MKKVGKTLMAVVLGFILVMSVGCASTPKPSGFLGEYAKDLQPGPKDAAKERWIKSGVNFAKYNKIMLDSVIFYFADDSEYKGIDPVAMKELADACHKEMVNVLNPAYPIVAEPGLDVLRIRFAITDLKQSRPILSGVTSIVPIGLGISIIKKGATGSWTGSGATTAEMMALDSMTNDVIAVAHDERTAGFTERFTKWGSAEDAFKYWGEKVKKYLDDARSMKQ
jgi:hypothetical protein